jgi:hypothetical protein
VFIFNFYLGLSQLTLDEKSDDYESVSDQNNTINCRSDDSLSATRQNTVSTFDFVDKNNPPNLETFCQDICKMIQNRTAPKKWANQLRQMKLRREQEVCF